MAETKLHCCGLRCPIPLAKVSRAFALMMLSKLGYQASIARNGIEALECLQAGVFDAVLMDCLMPDMDGYDATRVWRKRESSRKEPRLPILAMTAHAMVGDERRARDAGMDGYITKPVRLATLAEVLNEALRLKGGEEGQGAQAPTGSRGSSCTGA